MQIPIVNQCCCGCTLRTGCLIIGWLWVAGSLIELITSSIKADNLLILASSNAEDAGAYTAVRGFAILNALLASVELIFSLCLVYGTAKFKPSFILPWLYCYAAAVVINILVYMSVAIICFVSLNVGAGFGVLILGCLQCALALYCLLVVNSYYMLLKEDETVPVP